MIMQGRYAEARSIPGVSPGFLLVLCLLLMQGCGHHQPAPVEEHSSASIKRQLNTDGTYFVRSGDTLYAIAFNYGLDPQNVAKWNEISSPYVIYPGQKLRLSEPPTSRRASGSSSSVQVSAVKPPGQTTTKPLDSPGSTSRSTTPVKTPVSSSADPKSWQWPTNGRVLRTYIADDPARNGLDIAGKEGQDIKATSSGQVVYSGSGLIGYGELIIIKHSEKMLSAYAHNKVRLVKEGDQVSAGQKIAEMGRNAGNEQILHFEIRARGKPANPLIYLPKQ